MSDVEYDKELLESWIEINTAALTDNITYLAAIAQRHKKESMLMVKANAYGHGLLGCARIAETLGMKFLGVTHLQEAVHLRKSGITMPILLFCDPTTAYLEILRQYSITTVVSHLESLKILCADPSPSIIFHIKINTGLNRYGFTPAQIPEILQLLKVFHKTPQGILTHYSSAANDLVQTGNELKIFTKAVELFRQAGHCPTYVHASNSAANIWLTEDTTNLVRLGLAAYGLQPNPARNLPLSPVMSWKCRLSVINSVAVGAAVGYGGSWIAPRRSRIGIIPVGYSDGLRRSPQHQTYLLGGGARLPIISEVMMNHTFIDLTDAPGTLSIGDVITLLGVQGEDCLGPELIASQINTINEEVVVGLSPEIPRLVF